MHLLDWVLSLRGLFLWLSFCLSVPSVVLLCAQIGTILRHKQFRSTSFYTLFIVRAVPDFLYVLDSYYGFRLPTLFGSLLYPLYSALPNFALVTFHFVSPYTLQANSLATGFILLNRLTAVALPLKHQRLWRRLLPVSVLAVYALPLGTCAFVFQVRAQLYLQYSADNDTSSMSFAIGEAHGSNILVSVMYMNVVCSVLFLVGCTLINAATFIVYRKSKASVADAHQQSGPDVERKLTVYAVATFVGHVLIALVQIGVYLWLSNAAAVSLIFSQYPWVMDSCTVVLSSWLLLWASESFRRQFLTDLLPKWAARRWLSGEHKTVSNKSKVLFTRVKTVMKPANVPNAPSKFTPIT